MKFFDDSGFYNYYKNTSKYAKKDKLCKDFWSVWYDKFGNQRSLTTASWALVNNLFNAQNKKDMKIKLISLGHTAQAVDSFYRSLSQWLKATK